MENQSLSSEQIEHFLRRGFIKIEEALPRDLALEWGARGWARIETDPDDVSTWRQTRHHLPAENFLSVRENAPTVWQATQQLLGADWNHEWQWGDSFIFNLGDNGSHAWVAPQNLDKGWHKDGDFFRHFLDSPEQALLTIVLWTDVAAQSGGTFLACDSVPIVARYLAEHPEGVAPNDFPFTEMKRQCHDFEEATGRAGDVFLMHPFLLHTASLNQTRNQRIITNPPTSLSAPMNFSRANFADQSVVERAILNGLGVEEYDFKPTTSRQKIVPQRILNNRKGAEEKAAQLTSATKNGV